MKMYSNGWRSYDWLYNDDNLLKACFSALLKIYKLLVEGLIASATPLNLTIATNDFSKPTT